MAIAIIAIKMTPYAAAVPKLKSRIAEAIAIDTGRFVGVNTSTEGISVYRNRWRRSAVFKCSGTG